MTIEWRSANKDEVYRRLNVGNDIRYKRFVVHFSEKKNEQQAIGKETGLNSDITQEQRINTQDIVDEDGSEMRRRITANLFLIWV